MATIQKAENLNLPEQMFIILTNPETGEPRFDAERVKRALGLSVLWELINQNALQMQNNEIIDVSNVIFPDSYLRKATMIISRRLPVSGIGAVLAIIADLHPIWRSIGEDMVSKHLLTEDVQTRFCFFHRRVLAELAEAREDKMELTDSLHQAVRKIWDANYNDELAKTHPRLLARLVILDNYDLLQQIIGPQDYSISHMHIAQMRTHLQATIQQAATAKPYRDSGSAYDGGIYDSGSNFWLYDSSSHDAGIGSGDAHSHQGHDGHDGHGGHDGHSDSDSSSSSDSGGGDSGGCSGCGGCGS